MWLALGDPIVRSTARSWLQFDFKICAVSVSPTPDDRGCWAGLEEGHRRFSQHFWKGPQGSHFPPPPVEDRFMQVMEGQLWVRLCAHTQPYVCRKYSTLFHRWRNGGSEGLKDLSHVTQLPSGRADSNPTLFYIQSSSFFKKNNFVCFWLCRVFTAACALL